MNENARKRGEKGRANRRSKKTSDRDAAPEEGRELSLHRVRPVAPGAPPEPLGEGSGAQALGVTAGPSHPLRPRAPAYTGAPRCQPADSRTAGAGVLHAAHPWTPRRTRAGLHSLLPRGLVLNPRAFSVRTRRENAVFGPSSNCSLFNSLEGI